MIKYIVFILFLTIMFSDIHQAASLVGDDIFQHVTTPQPHVSHLAFSLRHYPVSLNNLRYFPNLRSLQIPSGQKIKSLAPLIAIAHSIKSLQLDRLGCSPAWGGVGEQVLSLEPLGELTHLSTLRMRGLCLSSSIKPLASLKRLKVLNFAYSSFIKDLDCLGNLKKLEKLNLYGGFFRYDKDNALDFLKGNIDLTYLNIGGSDFIHDLSPVFSLNKLKTLILGYTDYCLDSLEGIENLQDLEVLDVGSLIFDLPRVGNEVNEYKMQPLKKLKKLHTIAYCDVEFDLPEEWDIRKVLPQVSTVKDHIESSNQDWE